jgi:serine/threonine protein phosphatase 1
LHAQPLQLSGPEPSRIYAIGDVHGRLDLLDRLIDRIGAELSSSQAEHALVVTLGDYVDRGPKSAGVLDRLTDGCFPCAHVALRGNHEEILLSFLDDAAVLERWRRQGAVETLISYGVPVGEVMRGRGLEQARTALLAALPESHMAFLKGLGTSLTVERYFFCHAGVRPGVPLDRQSARDLAWIRDEFLSSTADFGKVVVHGHTPVPKADIRPNRINVDTGAFLTGTLSCAVLEGERVRILTA